MSTDAILEVERNEFLDLNLKQSLYLDKLHKELERWVKIYKENENQSKEVDLSKINIGDPEFETLQERDQHIIQNKAVLDRIINSNKRLLQTNLLKFTANVLKLKDIKDNDLIDT